MKMSRQTCVYSDDELSDPSESHLLNLTLFVKRWWEDDYSKVCDDLLYFQKVQIRKTKNVGTYISCLVLMSDCCCYYY